MGWEEDREAERARRSEFAGFCATVAAELGAELDPDPDRTWGVQIVSAAGNGTGYSLSMPGRDGKTEISPIYPNSTYGGGSRGRIGVSVSRGPRAVAAEITRRLVPVYRERLAAIVAHDAEEAAQQNARAALAARIEALFPPNPEGTGDDPGVRRRDPRRVYEPGRLHSYRSHNTDLVVRPRFHEGGTVKFSGWGAEVEFEGFRVPAEAAVAMLAALAEWTDAWRAAATPPAPAGAAPPEPPAPPEVPQMTRPSPPEPPPHPPGRAGRPAPAPQFPAGSLDLIRRLADEAGTLS
jgi:hypothetical protein